MTEDNWYRRSLIRLHFRKKLDTRWTTAKKLSTFSQSFLNSKKPAVYAGLMQVAEEGLEPIDLRVMSDWDFFR